MNSPEYAVILLAAGNSSRMGSPKQLLDYRGIPLVRHATEIALGTECPAVVVVLGANALEVRKALDGVTTGQKKLAVVENPRWLEGMGTSIQTGVNAVESLGLDGAILALADQPLITPEILNRLLTEHQRTSKPIITSRYAGTVGVPVFFAKSHFPQLMALAPDQGCKGVILRNGDAALAIDCPEAEADIDTPFDYEMVRRK